MRNKLLISIILVLVLILIQSTVLHYISPDMILPDLSMIVVLLYASRKGVMEGQVLGFISGLAEDFLTVSPPGFNALIKTILGFMAGILKNKLIFDPVLFPVLFIFLATLLKYVLAYVTAYVFLDSDSFSSLFNNRQLLEILLNSLLAPLVYFLLKHSKLIPTDIWSSQK